MLYRTNLVFRDSSEESFGEFRFGGSEGSEPVGFLAVSFDDAARKLLPGGKAVEEEFAVARKVLRHWLGLCARVEQAGVAPVYSTTVRNDGILIAPARFPHATLYAVSSEADETAIAFRDERSGKEFSNRLHPGRAALLLVGEKGDLLASY